MDIESGEETRVTDYMGDVQLLWLMKVPEQNSWLVHRFDSDGSRNLVLIDRETGEETEFGDGQIDNRKPVLSPDGRSIAYTSLRDDVPNVFRYNFESGEEKRVTNLFTGGEVYGWITEDDSLQTEKLLINASETKRRDQRVVD